MSLTFKRPRRMATLIAAGMLTAGLLQLGSASIASASTPAGPTAAAVADGILPPPVGVNNYAFSVNGAFAEYVPEVNLSGFTLTVYRFPGAYSSIDSWWASESDPKATLPYNVSVATLDYSGNTIRLYVFSSPVITRVTSNGSSQELTITYSTLTIY